MNYCLTDNTIKNLDKLLELLYLVLNYILNSFLKHYKLEIATF